MDISAFAIRNISPFLVDNNTGKEIVKFFGEFGIKDIYDEDGLPDIGLKNERRPSKTGYVDKRLDELSQKGRLREVLISMLNRSWISTEDLQRILQEENFAVEIIDGSYIIHGGVVDNSTPIINEAHFQEIQDRILKALDEAKISITVAMAWFTNQTLFEKLMEKFDEGLEIKLAIYDDGINGKHGVDISKLPHTLIKRGQRGGLMHNKFCVLDNQVVITGSYNWSDNAEFRNDENVTVEYDPKQATKYSLEFRRLTK